MNYDDHRSFLLYFIFFSLFAFVSFLSLYISCSLFRFLHLRDLMGWKRCLRMFLFWIGVCSYSWLPFNDESRSISCVVAEQRPTSWFRMGWHHKIKCTENLPTRSAKQHRCRRINQTRQGRRSQIDRAKFEQHQST